MDSAVKRPWYRLHWVTWVVMAVVVWSFTGRQVQRDFGGGTQDFVATVNWWYLGWPVWHLEQKEIGVGVVSFGAAPPTFEYQWRPTGVFLNVVSGILLLTATVFVIECWLRNPNRRQISLWQLFSVVTIVAAMLALVVHGQTLQLADTRIPRSRGFLIAWDDVTQPWRWPLLFALACTIYSLCWLTLALLRRAYRFVRP